MASTDTGHPGGPALGFGASGAWGATWFSDATAGQVLETALEVGITHFDTAGFYTGGESEARLGRWLQRLGAASGVTVATKVGKRIDRQGRLVQDVSEPDIRAAIHRSQERLGRDRLDIVYLHGPSAQEIEAAMPVLQSLKADGAIGAIGLCADGAGLGLGAADSRFDWVMARQNIFVRDNEGALGEARENGKAIAGVAPLAQALWRRDFLLPRTPSQLFYLSRALVRSPRLWRQARAATWMRDVEGWSPLDLALAYVRASGLVTVALTTTTRPEHLRQTAASWQRQIPPDIQAKLLAMGRA